jgi:5'(3')-deoxyribonucleotidase
MVERKRIMLDCDGVLADWLGHVLSKIGSGFRVEDCDVADMRAFLRRHRGQEAADKFEATCAKQSFVATQPVLPWANELVSLARNSGELLIATAPWQACIGWHDARIWWLKKKLNIKPQSVMVGAAKHWLSADVFVDDIPENIIPWCNENPKGKGFLIAWPYNAKHPSLPTNAKRVEPNELLEFFKNLEKNAKKSSKK